MSRTPQSAPHSTSPGSISPGSISAAAPLEPEAFKRGPGGRPTRDEAERRHQSLLSTTFRLFLDKGWDGVSVDEISRQSGVAKGFIYARYADKSALFIGAIERLMAEAIGTLQITEPLPDNIEDGLVAFGHKLLDVVLRPDALAFHRQFIAEANRFPELAKLFIAKNRVRDIMLQVLTTYAERGAIRLVDPNGADPSGADPSGSDPSGSDPNLSDARLLAEHFAILVVGIPRTLALLVGREPPAEEERRLRAAVRLFLDGCRNPSTPQHRRR